MKFDSAKLLHVMESKVYASGNQDWRVACRNLWTNIVKIEKIALNVHACPCCERWKLILTILNEIVTCMWKLCVLV